MRTDPDVTRAVRSWLDEGVDRLPERVLDSVLDAVPTTPQRRSWWPARRSPHVSMLLRTGTIAALLVVGLVVGAQLFGFGGLNVGGQPTPTASPSPSPTPSASTLAASDVGSTLAPGTHAVGAPFPAPFSITLPAGMTLEALNNGSAAFRSQAGFLGMVIPEAVFEDPCHVDSSPVPQTTVDGFIDALSRMPGFSAVDVTDTTVGGKPARKLLLTNTVDTATANCTRDLMLPLFTTPDSPNGAETNGGMPELLYVFEVGGRPVLLAIDTWPTEADRQSLESIAETITIP